MSKRAMVVLSGLLSGLYAMAFMDKLEGAPEGIAIIASMIVIPLLFLWVRTERN